MSAQKKKGLQPAFHIVATPLHRNPSAQPASRITCAKIGENKKGKSGGVEASEGGGGDRGRGVEGE